MNIAQLRNHCTLNLCSSISGVFPNNQDHRIQLIVEDYEADPQISISIATHRLQAINGYTHLGA